MLIRLNVSIPKELRDKAKVAAAVRGDTISSIVREALEDYIAATLEGEEDFEAALAAYERYKQDPESARPYSEIRKELVAEGLLSE